jgi:AraC-like DNA-binding protein
MPSSIAQPMPDDPDALYESYESHDVPASSMPSAAHPIRVRGRPLRAGVRIGQHTHPWAQVAYTTRGVLRMTTRDTTWIVPPSRALWVPPHVTHEVIVVEDAYLRTLFVDATVAPAGLTCRVVEVSGLLREMIAAFDVPLLSGERERWLGHLILDELGRSEPLPLSVPMPDEKRLRALCEAILANPGRSASLESWAASVGASTRTVARLFRQELGLSFSQWRQQAVLAHAIPLVSNGYPLSRIAHELGYTSQSAFSAMFRRAFGESPRTFFARGLAHTSR